MLPMVHDTHKDWHGHLTDIVWTWLNMFELFRSVWGRPVLQPETNPWQPMQWTNDTVDDTIGHLHVRKLSGSNHKPPIGSNWFLDMDPIVLANLHLSDLHCLRCLRYGGLIDVQRTKCHRSLLLGSGKQLPGRRWYTDMLQFDNATPEAHGGWGSMNLDESRDVWNRHAIYINLPASCCTVHPERQSNNLPRHVMQTLSRSAGLAVSHCYPLFLTYPS